MTTISLFEKLHNLCINWPRSIQTVLSSLILDFGSIISYLLSYFIFYNINIFSRLTISHLHYINIMHKCSIDMKTYNVLWNYCQPLIMKTHWFIVTIILLCINLNYNINNLNINIKSYYIVDTRDNILTFKIDDTCVKSPLY